MTMAAAGQICIDLAAIDLKRDALRLQGMGHLIYGEHPGWSVVVVRVHATPPLPCWAIRGRPRLPLDVAAGVTVAGVVTHALQTTG